MFRTLCASVVCLLFWNSGFGQTLGENRDIQPRLAEIHQSNFEIGLKNGINAHLMTLNPPPTGNIRWEFGSGFSSNLFMKFGSNTGFALTTEPGYLRKQSKLIQPQPDSTFTLTYQMNYISLPVYGTYQGSFNYLFGELFQQFYFSAGWSFNFLTDARLQIDNEQIDFAQIEYITDEVNPLEMAFILNAGSRFVISESSSLFLEVKSSQGISDLNNGLPVIPQAFEVSHFGVSFYVGFSTSISTGNGRNDSGF